MLSIICIKKIARFISQRVLKIVDAAGLVDNDLMFIVEGQCVLAAGGPSTKDSVKGYYNAGISNCGAGASLF